MEQIMAMFKFKGDTWAEPGIYTGANINSKIHKKVKLQTIRSREYPKAVISELEVKLHKEETIYTKARTPISSIYKPELDKTTKLKSK